MLASRPTELRLTLAPQRRFEAIDVNTRIVQEVGDVFRRHSRALYCSLHTTAGYLEQSLSTRLRQDGLSQFFGSFTALFPEGAEYRHDRMELRTELSDAQKEVEPRNADSHLRGMIMGQSLCLQVRNSAVLLGTWQSIILAEFDGPRKREIAVQAPDPNPQPTPVLIGPAHP